MINSKTKFTIYNPETDKENICTIRCVRNGEYYADDIETDLLVTDFNTEEIVELMFTSELERRSEFTGRSSLYVKAIG